MKKFLIITLLFISTKLFAYSPSWAWLGSDETFKLEPVKDSVLIGCGVALNGTEIFCRHVFNLNQKEFTGIQDKNSINAFDRFFMNPYSEGLDKASDVFVGLAFASPLLFLGCSKEHFPTLLTMYIETLLLSKGTVDCLKLAASRTRPYMYYEDYPQTFIDDGDWCKSWPSGHTTYTFATAAFVTYTLLKLDVEKPISLSISSGVYALALTTAILRIKSGSHFATDVLTGAAIGTAWGIFVPWLHETKSKNNPVTITPTGFNVTLKF